MKYNKMLASMIALGFAALTVASPSFGAKTKTTVPKADADFASDAAQGSMSEVILGRYAATHATNPQVRAFGARMVKDHTKAGADLKKVAAKEHVKLPTTRSIKLKMMGDEITMHKGASFDKAYIDGMVKDHTEDVAAFQKEATDGTDPGIKGFATRTLPVVQKHLAIIKGIQAKMGTAPLAKAKTKMKM